MKIFALFFIVFILPFSINAQIVNIPDPVFKQRLLDEGVDTNGDDEIQVSEAEAVNGALFVTGEFEDIFDLTGIEAFVNITELHCEQNQLSNLDLSQNINLIVLKCFDNPLETLNITQCALLEELYSDGCNLTTIDLSQNINLILLDLFDNDLTSLDVTQNINLESFGCSSNELTLLDIRNGNNSNLISFASLDNPNLKCVFVNDSEYMETTFGGNIDPHSTFVETQAECDALSIEEQIVENLKIYPNPTYGLIKLEGFSIDQETEILVTNILGQIMLQSQGKQTTVDLNNLEKGIYLLSIYINRKRTLTKKILKL